MALSFLFAELLGRLYVSVCAVWECGRECPAPQRAAGHASACRCRVRARARFRLCFEYGRGPDGFRRCVAFCAT